MDLVTVPKYMKQKVIELKGETDKSIIVVEDFNPPLSVIDRKDRPNIIKDIKALNYTINEFDQTDIYTILHLTKTKHIFFLSARGT